MDNNRICDLFIHLFIVRYGIVCLHVENEWQIKFITSCSWLSVSIISNISFLFSYAFSNEVVVLNGMLPWYQFKPTFTPDFRSTFSIFSLLLLLLVFINVIIYLLLKVLHLNTLFICMFERNYVPPNKHNLCYFFLPTIVLEEFDPIWNKPYLEDSKWTFGQTAKHLISHFVKFWINSRIFANVGHLNSNFWKFVRTFS